MSSLRNFCMITKDALDVRVCDELIEVFKANPDYHERYDNNGTPNFTQLNLTKHKELIPEIQAYLSWQAWGLLQTYKESVSETKYWPGQYMFEEFRIKHYKGDGHDQFDMHVDAISASTAKRFFAFFWYLNDVEEGGETVFPTLDLVVKPTKSTSFMFPPLWLYPHRGNPVTKGEKYLLSSYLHYME